MCREQKSYSEEQKEQARALFATETNLSRISRKLDIPLSTLRGWKKAYDEDCEKDPVLAEARDAKKREFVNNCWAIMNDTVTVLARRIKRAMDEEDEIDQLIDAVTDEATELDLDWKKTQSIICKVESLKCEDIVKLTTVMGTLYDKQALASGDNTANVSVTPFEGL